MICIEQVCLKKIHQWPHTIPFSIQATLLCCNQGQAFNGGHEKSVAHDCNLSYINHNSAQQNIAIASSYLKLYNPMIRQRHWDMVFIIIIY